MNDFLRTAQRMSRALRSLRKLAVVGGPMGPTGQKLLDQYLDQPPVQLDRADLVDSSFDAVLLIDQAGIADLDQLGKLAAGRQVVCTLEVLAELVGEDVVSAQQGEIHSAATVKRTGRFLKWFAAGDVIPWRGRSWLARGKAFGWESPKRGLDVLLQDFDGRILACQVGDEAGSIVAIDLAGLEAMEDGFSDLAGQIVLECLGAQTRDLGLYVGPWVDYAAHIARIEAWVATCPGDLVDVRMLEPTTAMGKSLRLVRIAPGQDKPAIVLSCSTHGHEWGPAHGVFAYLRWLMGAYQRGDLFARALLDRYEIAWIPVVNADGFDETFARGLLIPHGPSGVDINRNWDPGWAEYEGDRHKGAGPMSEPESQALMSVLNAYAHRGRLHSDYHECGRGFFPYSVPDPWVDSFGEMIDSIWNERLIWQDLGSYHRDHDIEPVCYLGRQPGGTGGCGIYNYSRSIGFAHTMVSEFFGNDDFTLYQTLGRIEAAGLYTEQLLGSLMGRTVWNWRIDPMEVRTTLPECDPSELLTVRILSADGQDRLPAEQVTADQGWSGHVPPASRLLLLRQAGKTA